MNPLRLFEFEHTYLIELHLSGIRQKDVCVEVAPDRRSLYITCRYQRKMFYESSSSYSDTYCTLPSVFKHRLSFQGNEIDSNEVVIKVAEEEGILVVIAPKKSQTSGDNCDYDSRDAYFHPEVASF